MIERAPSFSKGGQVIERVMEIEKYKIGRDELNKMLRSKSSKLAQYKEKVKQPIQIQGFDKVPGREKLNSFQIHKTKDAHVAIDYDNKKDFVLAKSSRVLFTKQKDERLSELLKQQVYAKDDVTDTCKKHTLTNNEHIRTANDLHAARKTFHSLTFEKQTSRPFDQNLKKMSLEVQQKMIMTRSNSVGAISQVSRPEKNTLINLHKVHSFSSYTKRDFLPQKQVKGAPEVSGIESFKINPQKFKSNWKVVNPPKFEQMTDRHLNRYDRDCPHWFTQLAYNIKDTKKSIKSHLDFQTQTLRKQNLVQSNYPIRLAI